MSFLSYLQQTFEKMSKDIPGFISISLIKSNDGTIVASYPSELKQELEMRSPFHLQVYKQSRQSLDVDSGADNIKEIMITTGSKLYVIGSKSHVVIGVLTLDIEKANLGLTKAYLGKLYDEMYLAFKQSNVFSPQ